MELEEEIGDGVDSSINSTRGFPYARQRMGGKKSRLHSNWCPCMRIHGSTRRTRDVKKTDNADYMFEIDTFQTMHGNDERQELTYDYGYPVGNVLDADGNERVIKCHCGKASYRGRNGDSPPPQTA
ncbi:hypothetical protein C5167_021448 [Papaver somniferum]|nr:hypothetical protein C5167_021448 [Papaver somniferum]